MRKLLNTLYVTTPESYLTKDGENVVIKIQDEIKFRIPAHNLEGIVTFGYAGASPGLMKLCAERGIGLSFMTEYGKFIARVTGKVSGNVLLRRKQYRLADNDSECVKIASAFVAGKIANARVVLQRAIRDHGDSINSNELNTAVNSLSYRIKQSQTAISLDELRGIEGDAARVYFSVFNQLIIAQKDSFAFTDRNRRPPTDPVNALLSFLYTLLMHDVCSALETVGLDPAVGFLHRDRPGRPSLALDLMEELRAYIADRLVLSLINRKQISISGFVIKENGAVYMKDDTRKEILTAWQKRKQEEISHPYLNETIPIGLLPYIQALLLARFIRGDIDGYPPFFWK